jgi:hypothetical protein
MIKNDYHLGYYFFLITILLIGLIITWQLAPNKDLQFLSFVILSMIYATIGIIHHFIDHDLVGKIVIEYILIAILGIAAAFFIFKGGFGI